MANYAKITASISALSHRRKAEYKLTGEFMVEMTQGGSRILRIPLQ